MVDRLRRIHDVAKDRGMSPRFDLTTEAGTHCITAGFFRFHGEGEIVIDQDVYVDAKMRGDYSVVRLEKGLREIASLADTFHQDAPWEVELSARLQDLSDQEFESLLEVLDDHATTLRS